MFFRLNYILLSLLVSLHLISAVHAEEALLAPEVRYIPTVDWEGTTLKKENLEAMRKFREVRPNIHFVHFLNAAYFTKKGIDPEDIAKRIQSVLLPGDELGLHIHSWQSLVEAAGVKYKSGPTYEGDPISRNAIFEGDIVDRGHDVPLSDYSTDEIRKIVRKSIEILNKNGFKNIKSFRTGGWLGAPHVLAAIAAEGITVDSSLLPINLKIEFPIAEPLRKMSIEVARNTNFTTQPFEIPTPFGAVKEFPNSAGMADYVNVDGILSMFKANFQEMLRTGATGMHFNLGFHQETANIYLYKIGLAIDDMQEYLKDREGVKLRNVTFAESLAHPLPTGKVTDCRTIFEKIWNSVFH